MCGFHARFSFKTLREKCPNTQFFLVFSTLYLSLRIQPECGKIWTRKNSVFGYFSRSGRTPKNLIYSALFILFLVRYDIFQYFNKTHLKCNNFGKYFDPNLYAFLFFVKGITNSISNLKQNLLQVSERIHNFHVVLQALPVIFRILSYYSKLQNRKISCLDMIWIVLSVFLRIPLN